MQKSITTILTQYKRPHLHALQVDSIRNQSVNSKIICWINGTTNPVKITGVEYITCDSNWKFHARFALSLVCQSYYISIIDDDIIPGKDWYKNCLKYEDSGILGASGVKLLSHWKTSYKPYTKYGHLENHNKELTEVDLVGHAWFFQKEFVRPMFSEEPYSYDNGEDIQLSALAKVKTYVPPHPIENTDIWGCLPQYNNLGNDDKATFIGKNHLKLRNEICHYYSTKGIWK